MQGTMTAYEQAAINQARLNLKHTLATACDLEHAAILACRRNATTETYENLGAATAARHEAWVAFRGSWR